MTVFVVGGCVEVFVDYFGAYLNVDGLLQEDSLISLAVPVGIGGICAKYRGDLHAGVYAQVGRGADFRDPGVVDDLQAVDRGTVPIR